ncbi:hypothetical protein E2C01_073237 [Portunus trituberculatus]|uniref:Uncharacterized protein n=1 Tax=Portunus trituberculatus TaxID=210409 RepID=A0A5B7I2A3_PORTR|nr:hypothetical protein [Portunus trituberculatus]
MSRNKRKGIQTLPSFKGPRVLEGGAQQHTKHPRAFLVTLKCHEHISLTLIPPSVAWRRVAPCPSPRNHNNCNGYNNRGVSTLNTLGRRAAGGGTGQDHHAESDKNPEGSKSGHNGKTYECRCVPDPLQDSPPGIPHAPRTP